MPKHVRQQIREAAAAALTGLSTTGQKVYPSRIKILADSELPCLLVFTNNESVSPLDINSHELDRNLELIVVGCVKQGADIDDKLDTIIMEVEQVLNQTTLGGLCNSVTLGSIEVELNGEGEKPVGKATMTFNATYNTQAAVPDVATSN